MEPKCIGQHDLFDSDAWADHLRAKALCLKCPYFDHCREQLERANQQTMAPGCGPKGTWAGMLFREKKVDCGTRPGFRKHVLDGEEPCEACKRVVYGRRVSNAS